MSIAFFRVNKLNVQDAHLPPHPSAEAQVGQTGGAAASSGELPRRRRRRRPTGRGGMRQWDYAANSDGADG